MQRRWTPSRRAIGKPAPPAKPEPGCPSGAGTSRRKKCRWAAGCGPGFTSCGAVGRCCAIRCTSHPSAASRLGCLSASKRQRRFDVRTHKKLTVGIGTTIAALLLAGPAQASTAADDQYSAVLGEQGGGTVQGESGGLPFTGLDLLLVGGVGTALTAGGVLIRRIARVPNSG